MMKPVYDWIRLQMEEAKDETTKGGIFLAPRSQTGRGGEGGAAPIRYGRVLEVGPGAISNGTFVPVPVKKGDRVMVFAHYEHAEPEREVWVISASAVLECEPAAPSSDETPAHTLHFDGCERQP